MSLGDLHTTPQAGRVLWWLTALSSAAVLVYYGRELVRR